MSETQDISKPLSHDDAVDLKHVEMVQNIISRMANNNSVYKNWFIVLVFLVLLFIGMPLPEKI